MYPGEVVPRRSCTQEKLYPGEVYPGEVLPRRSCTQEKLYPGEIVSRRSCTQEKFYLGEVVPRRSCTQEKLCPREVVPRRSCTQEKLCPGEVVPMRSYTQEKLYPGEVISRRNGTQKVQVSVCYRYLKFCKYPKFCLCVSSQVVAVVVTTTSQVLIKASKRGHVVIYNLNHMRLGVTLRTEFDIDSLLKAFHHFFYSLVACQHPSIWLFLKSHQYVKSYKILIE